MNKKPLSQADPEIAQWIQKETARQNDGLEMIPSENHCSAAVRQALGSVLTDKYSEGYPKKRYYGGNKYVDQIELLAIERAKKVFRVEHVNVQPYSGSPANQAVYFALLKPGETVMGHHLFDGGHLTHGCQVNFSGTTYNSVQYHVDADGLIDLAEVERLAQEHKPKLIWCGATAYPREFQFEAFAKIADEIGAYLATDIAHVAGLVAGGVHKSPTPYAHVVTTTTHKTLRGPRGALIMVTKKGLEKDSNLDSKIDKAVFPGLQGGPHNHQTAAIAVALDEALQPEFKDYAKQIVKNSKALAKFLMDNDIKLVSNGSENHLILADLTPFGQGKGLYGQDALEAAGVTVNKNTIPADPSSPFYPSGIRLGTPALTTRGMKETEMEQIGSIIAQAVKIGCAYDFSEDKVERKDLIKKFKSEIKENQELKKLKQEVFELCAKFPLYPKQSD
jgi:glycine hydroxymethyltransferase